MDDVAFLAQVEELLGELVIRDVVVTGVRPVDGRPWPRAEVAFRLADPPDWWRGPTNGSAYLPLAEDWRYANAYEEPEDYARVAAEEVARAARRLARPKPPSMPLTPQQVEDRWTWLIERLALNGTVRQINHDTLLVDKTDGGSFTVIVTPEQWASIAEPLDPDSDDPQDFNQLHEDEAFLVFYEGDLKWSVRPELPPVGWGAELIRAARARGETRYGWFATDSDGQRHYFSDSDGAADDQA